MLQKLDFYYFCLFNYFFRDGNVMRDRGGKVDPETRVCFVFTVILYNCTLLVRMGYKAFIADSKLVVFFKMPYAPFAEAVLFIALHFLFNKRYIKNERFWQLYAQYKNTSQSIQKKVSACIIVLFLLTMTASMFTYFYCVKYLHVNFAGSN